MSLVGLSSGMRLRAIFSIRRPAKKKKKKLDTLPPTIWIEMHARWHSARFLVPRGIARRPFTVVPQPKSFACSRFPPPALPVDQQSLPPTSSPRLNMPRLNAHFCPAPAYRRSRSPGRRRYHLPARTFAPSLDSPASITLGFNLFSKTITQSLLTAPRSPM